MTTNTNYFIIWYFLHALGYETRFQASLKIQSFTEHIQNVFALVSYGKLLVIDVTTQHALYAIIAPHCYKKIAAHD